MTLNTDLLALPKELGEFVIVHELVHLLAPNHGKVFKSFMHAYIPDWEVLEAQLQTYARKVDKKKGSSRTRPASKKRKSLTLAIHLADHYHKSFQLLIILVHFIPQWLIMRRDII